jgi:hypothetical protein
MSFSIEGETHSALILQSVLGAMRLGSLEVELNGRPIDGHRIYDFCVRRHAGLTAGFASHTKVVTSLPERPRHSRPAPRSA